MTDTPTPDPHPLQWLLDIAESYEPYETAVLYDEQDHPYRSPTSEEIAAAETKLATLKADFERAQLANRKYKEGAAMLRKLMFPDG